MTGGFRATQFDSNPGPYEALGNVSMEVARMCEPAAASHCRPSHQQRKGVVQAEKGLSLSCCIWL